MSRNATAKGSLAATDSRTAATADAASLQNTGSNAVCEAAGWRPWRADES